MDENEDAVLCFYCDAATEVRRNHHNILPQEYRSRLFSRMFDFYVKSHNITGFINHRVVVEDACDLNNKQFAHFICRQEHESAVAALGKILMDK